MYVYIYIFLTQGVLAFLGHCVEESFVVRLKWLGKAEGDDGDESILLML